MKYKNELLLDVFTEKDLERPPYGLCGRQGEFCRDIEKYEVL